MGEWSENGLNEIKLSEKLIYDLSSNFILQWYTDLILISYNSFNKFIGQLSE